MKKKRLAGHKHTCQKNLFDKGLLWKRKRLSNAPSAVYHGAAMVMVMVMKNNIKRIMAFLLM